MGCHGENFPLNITIITDNYQIESEFRIAILTHRFITINTYLIFCLLQEPVGFFVGGASSLLSFAWFLKTRRDFTYEAMHQRFMTEAEKKAFEEANFDIVDYNSLKHKAENLRELLEAYEEQQLILKNSTA